MKYCPKCAATYSDDAAFCLNDGTPLSANTANNQQQFEANQLMPTLFSGSLPVPPQNFQAQQQSQSPPFNQPPQIQVLQRRR